MAIDTHTIKQNIEKIHEGNFDEIARTIYEYQLENNDSFRTYTSHFNRKIDDEFIFLPISAFKSHKVVSGSWFSNTYFESSGTTSSINSKHYYKDLNWYLSNCEKGFTKFYGQISEYFILALLPHYLERQNSSLIAMVNHFITISKYDQSGFFLNETDQLIKVLNENKKSNIPTILFGVSFALKDFAEQNAIDFSDLIIIETGGMKGRQEEITREELHNIIQHGFGVHAVHSEYGMTELFSQAYSNGSGRYYPAPTMKVVIKEITDPLSNEKNNKTGIINVIDLANVDTCSFIATEDLGRLYDDGSFEVLGRMDNSDMRGCNLMIS